MPLRQFEISRMAPKPGSHGYRMAIAVGDDYFDGTSSLDRVRRHLQVARESGAKYLRCAFSWNAIERSSGKYDWKFWDRLVNEAGKAGIGLIPYVAYTPEWAAPSKQQFWSQPPRDIRRFADFIYKVVRRYRGRIHAWEIWNEPDNREYWQGSPRDFARLVRAAAIRMRQADPDVVLVLGGMSRGPSDFFRTLILEEKIDAYVDVVAMHAYPESWDEERAETVYEDWVREMVSMIKQSGSGADFWINEMGYADYRSRPNQASKWGTSIYYDYEHTPAYQAVFLFKSEVMALAERKVSLTGWYRIDDFLPSETHFSDDEVNYHLGLLDSTGWPKPAFRAFRFFSSLFSEPTTVVTTRGFPDPIRLNIFRKANGEFVIAGWVRSSTQGEVRNHNGMLHDARQETVSAPLPCRNISNLRTYDAEGNAKTPLPAFKNWRLDDILLSGDQVFVAVLNCQN